MYIMAQLYTINKPVLTIITMHLSTYLHHWLSTGNKQTITIKCILWLMYKESYSYIYIIISEEGQD